MKSVAVFDMRDFDEAEWFEQSGAGAYTVPLP